MDEWVIHARKDESKGEKIIQRTQQRKSFRITVKKKPVATA